MKTLYLQVFNFKRTNQVTIKITSLKQKLLFKHF